MAALQLDAELSPSRWAELGRPRGIFRRHDGVCAVSSTFDVLYWPARALYSGHSLKERVCIYAPDLRERWAVFDAARFPVNEVAFHPREPWAAIATGSYDGGYLFEGELWLWNWETSTHFRVLSESREVTRLRYLEDGRLALLMRPPDEGDFDGTAFDTFFGGCLDDLRGHEAMGLSWGSADPRLASFVPVNPASLGFREGVLSWESQRAGFDTAFENTPMERRHRVWDLAWQDGEHLIAVHDTCHVEVWRTSGDRLWAAHGPGHGIQILQHGGRSFVHVMERSHQTSTSRLMEVRGQALHECRRFDQTPLMSMDRYGRVLCRQTGWAAHRRSTSDFIVDPAGPVTPVNLGHYDCFNHHLRIDGAEALYFLRGTPACSHEHKVLCLIDEHGAIQQVCRWDSRGNGHLMETQACRLPQGGWVRVCKHYNPRGPGEFFMEGIDERGRSLWLRPVPSPATSLTTLTPKSHLLAYALTNGEIGIVDVRTGESFWAQPLELDGVASVALSLCSRGDALAMGTLDGRVLLWRWSH